MILYLSMDLLGLYFGVLQLITVAVFGMYTASSIIMTTARVELALGLLSALQTLALTVLNLVVNVYIYQDCHSATDRYAQTIYELRVGNYVAFGACGVGIGICLHPISVVVVE